MGFSHSVRLGTLPVSPFKPSSEKLIPVEMAGRNCASFEVLIESEGEDPGEVKQNALDWIRENGNRITEENIEVIQLQNLGMHGSRTLKIGDRVLGVVNNKQEAGTIVSFLLIGSNGPQAFVRFDNGALRALTLDRLELLE
ncbi:hypothetical protein AKJ65_01310 [candidate division MSBL1 archaeon SCGC-AAA259E19]|uniref:Uncharacterized protein n=1 Tax=candidate division MSBL1 archaeon SCGC-AAA259E19 TaxID=1698264 RepID=A0A133UNB6_9EURY|nr:hypothetical protein AKJ65_01310 [candidate division MSBL1 archaeon SCGC-AAA259E19]